MCVVLSCVITMLSRERRMNCVERYCTIPRPIYDSFFLSARLSVYLNLIKLIYPYHFEVLHLAYEAVLNTEILWVISTYCCYV